MPALILHHYDFSNFAEKIRLVLGHKRLSWASVLTPMFLPKPELTALTGGYRKVPVLQIGADIYCDTTGIALEIERRHPNPTLFPGATRGLALAIAYWAERSLLWPTARYATGMIADRFPEEFHADRAAMWKVPMNIERYRIAAPRHRLQMLAQLTYVESLLERHDGDFLLGNEIGLADFAVYHPLWLVGQCSATLTADFTAFPKMQRWMSRVEAIGHGQRSELDAKDAAEIASKSTPQTPQGISLPADPEAFSLGESVVVTPLDYGQDKVAGRLHALSLEQISVRRSRRDGREVVVNFPFSGYRINREAKPAAADSEQVSVF